MPLESTKDMSSSSSSSSNRWIVLQSLISASGCICSSSTSAVADAQVATLRRGLQVNDDDCHTRCSTAQVSNGDHPLMSASQRQTMPKKGFTGHFNKGYSRVSDVYTITKGEADQNCDSAKSRVKMQNKLRKREIQGDRCRTSHGKPDVCKWDNVCAAKFTRSYRPIVKYTWDPCKAFYESMMEMVLGGHLDGHDYLDLEEMFACFVVLNPAQHHLHIEEAFKLLLTNLYSIDSIQNSVLL
ncbi:hypothetical protein L7F22_014122 [Adiantum nelumboides]|nr:hypothetical protein [Adiantum nelumboides]